MKMKRREFLKLCAVAGAMALGLGCVEKKKEINETIKTGPKLGGHFIEGVSAGDAETLNWILAADSASFDYVGHTMDTLATYDNKFNTILRHLAKDIEVSEDGLVYTITIRDDLKWSDGRKVTAEDYVYTLKNLMFSDWLNYNYKSDWQEEVDGKIVFVKPEVVDENTFRIIRKTVYPEFVYDLYSLMPYPKHIAEKYVGDVEGFTQAKEFNNLTYTGNLGPYKFKEWIRNDKFLAERNPEYYLGQEDGSPYFESYTVKILGSPAARHAALEAGDVTMAGIDPLHVRKFKGLEDIKVYTKPTSGYTILVYNMRKNSWDGLKKKEVRQAISMSISKDSIIQSILLGFGEPAFSFIPNVSPWYTEEGVAKYGTEIYDKEKAMEILESYDVPILKLVTNQGNKVRESMSFLIKQELSDIGVEVDFKLVPWPTFLNKYLKNKAGSEAPRFNNGPDAVSEEAWDMCVIGFSTNPIAPSGQSVLYTTDGGLNFSGYSNAKVDELFRRVRSKEALDKSRRKELYGELSRVIADDQPFDFLAFQHANIGFDKRVAGIDPGINMGYNYHKWFFK